jgi:predicted Zn-dependent peptidase
MRRLAALVLLSLALATAAPFAWAAEPIQREQTANGLTVLVRENRTVPVVAASVMVRVGTRWEREDNTGITNLLQQVLVKGTQSRTALQIAEEAEDIGGSIGASGDIDTSEIRGTALARHWRRLLDLLADVALRPTLPEAEIEGERRSVQSALKSRADQPFQRAYDTAMGRVYGPHAYALPVLGRGTAVSRLDRTALLEHYRTFYRANRTIVSVSGDVSAREVFAEVRRLFAAMPSGDSAVSERGVSPVSAVGRELVTHPSAQAQIMVAYLGPGIAHKDYAAMKVLSVAVGGGMAGRLFTELRDKQGLAYSTGALNPSRVDPSVLVAYLGTAPANADRAEEGMLRELGRMTRERVTPEELARAKSYLMGLFNLDRRTNARLAWYQAFFEATGVGYDFAERYVQAVEAVTADDLLRVAQAYLTRPAVVNLRPAAR